MPLKAGKNEIFGVRATLKSSAAVARLTLVDDMDLPEGAGFGRIYSASMDKKTTILDERTVATYAGTMDVMFPEPIKTRRGVSVAGATNLVGGSIMLYIR
jgi:hypothetical protein